MIAFAVLYAKLLIGDVSMTYTKTWVRYFCWLSLSSHACKSCLSHAHGSTQTP